MDAATAQALSVVLQMELPGAFEAALQEMERSRMAAADIEARSQSLVAAMHFTLTTLDRLELPWADRVDRTHIQVMDMRNMVVAGLDAAGLAHVVDMADAEGVAMDQGE